MREETKHAYERRKTFKKIKIKVKKNDKRQITNCSRTKMAQKPERRKKIQEVKSIIF